MTAFDELSDEGKRQKIAAHLSSPLGYPVPASWVRWMMPESLTVRDDGRDKMIGGLAAIQKLCCSYYVEPKPDMDKLIQDIWREANFAMIEGKK